VRELVVVDIAPAAYAPANNAGWASVQAVVRAAAALDAAAFRTRPDVEAALAAAVPEPGVRSFVAQNLVPAPGGGYDSYGRLVAEYMQRNLPGSTFVVKNVPGAGHIIGANSIYASKADGLTLGTFNTGLIYNQLINAKGLGNGACHKLVCGGHNHHPITGLLVLLDQGPSRRLDLRQDFFLHKLLVRPFSQQGALQTNRFSRKTNVFMNIKRARLVVRKELIIASFEGG
jgi:hypothetical protein